MNFRTGQKVEYIGITGRWFCVAENNKEFPGPKVNEVVTIHSFDKDGDLFFHEYPGEHPYQKEKFRPLDELSNVGINDLLELLPFKEQKVKVNI